MVKLESRLLETMIDRRNYLCQDNINRKYMKKVENQP